ncbi:F-box/kelch-repeat protein At3g06240-like [Papaver somniferum]|uniref:F-box/kelch-repeat protein At3g06240-like n=1 Tax=Papaver somniferum TaxID=3469 RepID=UPI000E703E10|nr:F-box/kelch-repeat protein At3g06240-like [Papaver somniferum]XP_026379409.1 F-box/kelch-repeat protein At3g06240-like [Papaver somniferum]
MAHMLSLPEEILLDIFLRLAVMSLLPLRCVCKRLKTLLYSSKFVKMHLNYNVEKNNICVMFKDICSCERLAIYTVNSNALASSLTTYDSCDKVVEVEHPVIPPDYDCISILGSCDGLLCISACVSGRYDAEVTCIWNPSTGEYKKLPSSFKHFPNEGRSLYGFGYDTKIDDYKLVKVRDFDGKRGRSKFNVYMLGSNSWKRFQPIPYWFRPKFPGVLVNGKLHWLGVTRADNSSVIVSLDIGNEKFDEMSLPEEPLEAREALKYVGALEGCLCMISNSYDFMRLVDIWVMQEYGVMKSWSKRFRLTQVFIAQTYFTPLWSFRHGEILFETSQCLVLYNTHHNIVKVLKLCEDSHFPRIEWAENYVCSLVPVKSNVFVERKKSTTKPVATWVVKD